MARRAILIVCCALATFVSAFAFTRAPGPGLDPDAMSYLGAAESIARDGRVRVPAAPWFSDSTTSPLTHFPPGYPLLISAGVRLGVDSRTSARLVQSLAAAASITLMIVIAAPAVGALGGSLTALALLLSPAFILVHLSILSEPAFLALELLLLWAMVTRPRRALTHGLIAAAATMIRYAGLGFAGAAALWALRDRAASWRARLINATLAVAPSIAAMGAWSLSRRGTTDVARPIRKMALYGNWGPTLHDGWNSIGHLLAPSLEWDPIPTVAAVGTLVAIAAIAWVAEDAPRETQAYAHARRVWHAAAMLALGYAGLVLVSRLLADPLIPFDFRLTVPLVPLATVSVALIAARAWQMSAKPARVFGVLAFVGWCTAAVVAAQEHIGFNLTEGSDFANVEWRNSPTMAWVGAQPDGTIFYTNWTSAIWFHLHRQSHDVPETFELRSPAQVKDFVDRVTRSGGYVVLWGLENGETAPPEAVIKAAGLVPVQTFDDGAVYRPAAMAAATPAK